MAVNCDSVLKFFVFALNTVLFALGAAVAGIAGYIAFNKNSMFNMIITGLNISQAMIGLYILLGVGIVIVVVSILGCIGAYGENRLLLWLNFFFVLLIFIMQLVAVIMCFYKYKVVKKDMRDAIRESAKITISGSSNTSALALMRNVLGVIEEEKKCCGLYGPQDYGSYIPDSCLKNSSKHHSSKTLELRDEDTEFDYAPDETTSSGRYEKAPTTSSLAEKEPISENFVHETTASVKEVIAAPTTSTLVLTTQLPYTVGCIAFLKPIIYAAGGVAIGILLLELLLLIFVGWLLCEMGKEYEYLP